MRGIFVALMFILLSGFTNSVQEHYYIKVKVYCPNGRPAYDATVVGFDYKGFWNIKTNSVKTDVHGEATIEWDADDHPYLTQICVAGDCHKGKFYAGSTYTFTLHKSQCIWH